MTALELYKFLEENTIEIDWRDEELMAWIPGHSIDSFAEISDSYITDNPAKCHLVSGGYICIDLVPFCDYYDIDPKEIEEPATAVA